MGVRARLLGRDRDQGYDSKERLQRIYGEKWATQRKHKKFCELIQFCRSQLADVKCPRSIDFRDELPRHPTGKLYKRLLKDEYWKDAGRLI